MNDAADTLHDRLVLATAAGQPLESLQGKFFADEGDFFRSRASAQTSLPMAWMRIGRSAPVDALRGSRWQIMKGDIAITLVSRCEETSVVGWRAAREACETLGVALERVLKGLRHVTSDTNPLGAWQELSYTSDEGGPIAVPSGVHAWGKEYTATLTLCRWRAA